MSFSPMLAFLYQHPLPQKFIVDRSHNNGEVKIYA
jgi:hypothetical protein